jgi:hypothetical protein
VSTSPRLPRLLWLPLVSAILLTACSSAGISLSHVVPVHSAKLALATGRPVTQGPIPPVIPGVVWHRAALNAAGVATVYLAQLGLGRTAMWLDPTRLRFRFIPGVQYPENSPLRPIDYMPSTWVPLMAAAFNGGYKLSDGVGGYFYAGTTVAPLRVGLAAMFVGTNGSLRVGVWGRDVKSLKGLVAVRENLPPLVDQGVAKASPTDGVSKWGIPARHQFNVARSALGNLGDGSLMYVFMLSGTAFDLANELVHLGVRTAIDLDMNRGWPAAFVYRHSTSGTTGTKINPAIAHTADVYFDRPLKDFVVAMFR